MNFLDHRGTVEQPATEPVLKNLDNAFDVLVSCIKDQHKLQLRVGRELPGQIAALNKLKTPAFDRFAELDDDRSKLLVLQWIAAKTVKEDIEETLGAYIVVDGGSLCPHNSCAIRLKNNEKTAFENFKKKLIPAADSGTVNAYVYAVTPKEMVQRISDVAAQRRASQSSVSLNALLGAVGLGASLDRVRDTELMLHALRRQPLVVGFTDTRNLWKKVAGESKKLSETLVEFGWLIGPQYKLVEDRGSFFGGTEVTFSFRHVNRQNALAVVVAVPSWWKSLKLEVAGCWLESESGNANDCGDTGVRGMIDVAEKEDEDKFISLENGESYYPRMRPLSVRLPSDLSGITASLGVDQRAPIAFRQAVIADLTVGATGHVLVPGVHLWRNAAVTVGSQKADSVTVMPDMQGIIATFNQVLPPPGWPNVKGSEEQPVMIWTSTGRTVAGNARIFSRGVTVGRVAIATQPIILDQPLVLDVSRALLPENYNELKVALRRNDSSGLGNWTPHTTNLAVNGGAGTVTVSLDTPGCAHCDDGALVEAAFIVVPRPGVTDYHKSQNVAVIYKDAPSSQASILKNGTAMGGKTFSLAQVKKGEIVDIVFPVNVENAYRNFVPDGATIDVYLDSESKPGRLISVAKSACLPVGKNRKFPNQRVCAYHVSQNGLENHFTVTKTTTAIFKLKFRDSAAPAISETLTVTK